MEVRLRPPYAQWRYRLDVIVDQRYVYFDTFSRHVQNFKGVTVYTPTAVLNQSSVVIMFASGAGVEVVENNRFMTARVYLPITFMVSGDIGFQICNCLYISLTSYLVLESNARTSR